MTERRRYKRVTIKGEVNGKVWLSDNIDIKDISLSGIRFHTTRFVSPGVKCALTLQHKDRQIELKGTVVRSTLMGTKREGDDFIPVYEVAMAFEEMDSSSKGLLAQMLKSIEDERVASEQGY